MIRRARLPVAVLGATGAVGQRFLALLADHPWFDVVVLTGSGRTEGKRYAESARWILDVERPPRFDKIVLATHSDQALALLGDATAAEREVLGAIRYQLNHAVLHTDSSVLPDKKIAWAAWNYERPADASIIAPRASPQVCLHYLLNLLQPLPWQQPVIVSLNPAREIARNRIMGEFDYAHPVFDQAAIRAQELMPKLQGRMHTYFCGAWMGYGFHEDGLKAGLGVARQLLVEVERRAEQAREMYA